jgi:hypothetical protein
MAIPSPRQVPLREGGAELAQGQGSQQQPAPAPGLALPRGSGRVAHQGSGTGLWVLAGLSVAALIILIATFDGQSPMSP